MGLLGSDRLDRRGFLKRFGIAGTVGGAGIPCGTSPPWGRSPDFPRCWVRGAEGFAFSPAPAALAFGVAAGAIAP